MKILKKKKPKTKTWYKRELDRVFSIFIRQSYAVCGVVACYTCGREGEVKELQNGHFVPRQYMATRWDERNCRPQCYACNMLYNGQPSAYAVRLEAETPGIVKELEALRRTIKQWTIKELEEMIAKYKELIQ